MLWLKVSKRKRQKTQNLPLWVQLTIPFNIRAAASSTRRMQTTFCQTYNPRGLYAIKRCFSCPSWDDAIGHQLRYFWRCQNAVLCAAFPGDFWLFLLAIKRTRGPQAFSSDPSPSAWRRSGDRPRTGSSKLEACASTRTHQRRPGRIRRGRGLKSRRLARRERRYLWEVVGL